MSQLRRVLFAVTVLAVSISAIGLGRWQLRRLKERRASNAVLLAARNQAPLDLTVGHGSPPAIDSGRLVVARGQFDTVDQVVLRGRVQNDGPGVQIVTPFALEGGGIIWVVRGFVPSADAITLPDSVPAPESGTVTIRGLALALPNTADSGAPLVHNGRTTWKRLDRAAMARLRPGSLPVYLLLAGDATGPGRLVPVPPPVLDDGPHLSYALQWFGIALAVLTFGVIVFWRDGRARPPRPAAP